MMRVQILVGLVVLFLLVALQAANQIKSDELETNRITAQLRNDILSGSEVATVQICKELFNSDEVKMVKVTAGEATLCELVKSGNPLAHQTQQGIYFSADSSGPIAGTVRIGYSIVNAALLIGLAGVTLATSWIFLYIQYRRSFTNLRSKVLEPILRLAKRNQLDGKARENLHRDASAPEEIISLVQSFESMAKRVALAQEMEKQSEINQAQVLLAKQVAHDIRSPLGALSVVTATLQNLSNDKRQLLNSAIDRINGIADDLLKKGKESGHVLNVSSLIETVLSEKIIQLGDDRTRVIAEFRHAADCLIRANPSELQRIISNLINNALESLYETGGRVLVSSASEQQSLLITVADTGRGVAPEILSKLGQSEFTYGKEGMKSGSGLGLFHARRYLESIGGHLRIESEVGRGTKVTVQLPTLSDLVV
jgi:signal transduction histidine kinase